MTQWHTPDELPEEGRKVEMVFDARQVEHGVWLDGQLDYRPEEWDKVKLWRYLEVK